MLVCRPSTVVDVVPFTLTVSPLIVTPAGPISIELLPTFSVMPVCPSIVHDIAFIVPLPLFTSTEWDPDETVSEWPLPTVLDCLPPTVTVWLPWVTSNVALPLLTVYASSPVDTVVLLSLKTVSDLFPAAQPLAPISSVRLL